jgi:hypothetical protein
MIENYARSTGMRSHSRVEHRVHGSLETSPQRGGGARDAAISARHRLLSDSWTADVDALEGAIGRFTTEGNLQGNCEVVFFEIAGDGHLHVNVIHRFATKGMRGWAGPGTMPNGFVHNRRFADASQNEMIRHIRDMVFAPRI